MSNNEVSSPMTVLNKQALREAAEKATALNLDTAQVKRENDGYLECPCCEGAGYVEEENDFCNIDGVALGVQFYGIGEHHGLAELYLRAANPATVLALLDELETKEEQRANWFQMAQKLGENLDAAEKRIAELEAREIVLPKRLSPEGYHIDEAYMVDDSEGEYLDRDAVIDAIRAAGIGVKGE
ncbi:MAG: ead/Ea22-like family protein [Citrobacter portucalensis]|nr:ead/Ea22-like family protein [Citrobacter portucalensis]